VNLIKIEDYLLGSFLL